MQKPGFCSMVDEKQSSTRQVRTPSEFVNSMDCCSNTMKHTSTFKSGDLKITSKRKSSKMYFCKYFVSLIYLTVFFFNTSTVNGLPFVPSDIKRHPTTTFNAAIEETTTAPGTTLHRQQRSNIGSEMLLFVRERCAQSIIDGKHQVTIKISKESCNKINNYQPGSFSDELITNGIILQQYRNICRRLVSNINVHMTLSPKDLDSIVDRSLYDC
uniref:uncharacterized protein LOC120346111 n=1 Tax=Styela clava TaxID=7725 RepID=UPI001939AAF7|nr:uncharacterized protein LOC120346111 [Styela clava]